MAQVNSVNGFWSHWLCDMEQSSLSSVHMARESPGTAIPVLKAVAHFSTMYISVKEVESEISSRFASKKLITVYKLLH